MGLFDRGCQMEFIGEKDDYSKWELDTQAYVETYTKKIVLTGKDKIEFIYRLSLISDEYSCKRCGGIRFSYLVEVWDDLSGWIPLPEYDGNYYCSNHSCDEDGLKPVEFEKLFRSIQKKAQRIDLDKI